jgi:hypothetical protein
MEATFTQSPAYIRRRALPVPQPHEDYTGITCAYEMLHSDPDLDHSRPVALAQRYLLREFTHCVHFRFTVTD